MTTNRFPPQLRLDVFARDGSCVAPLVDANSGPCSGRLTVEHVRPLGGAMGAPKVHELRWCVSLCEAHTEPGMKAGRVWNLSHKSLLRRYLADVMEVSDAA